MSDDTEVAVLLAPMKDRAVDLAGDDFPVERSAVLAGMAAASRRPRIRWPVYAGALFAAIVLLAPIGVRWFDRARGTIAVIVPPGSEIRFEPTGGTGKTLAGTTFVAGGGALEVGAGSSAQLTTPDGVGIELQSDTRVALGSSWGQDARLDLQRGAVRCTVKRRPASRPFRVVAPEVTVVDLGTVFTVAIDPTTHATSVSVEEGEVLVAHQDRKTAIKANERWSTFDASTATVSAPPLPAASPSATAGSPAKIGVPGPPSKKGATPSPDPGKGTLGEESRLLRLGLAAERQGRGAEAVVLLEQLLSRYPKSPLAPDAREALRRVKQNGL